MENSSGHKFNIGNYVIIRDQYIGIIYKTLWNSSAFVVRLIGNSNYIDKTIVQYNLMEQDNPQGYMLITPSEQIQSFDLNKINELIEKKKSCIESNPNAINLIRDLEILANEQVLINAQENTNTQENTQLQIQKENANKINEQIYMTNKFDIYKEQAGLEDDYFKYINQMISNLFVEQVQIKWDEKMIFGTNRNSTYMLGDDNIENVVKPALISLLERFDPVDFEQSYDFTNTLMYKHLIYDDNIDTLSLGKELIGIIKKTLLSFQSGIELDDGTKLLDTTNLFDWLGFRIVGGYIEIYKLDEENSSRVITPELIQDLKELSFQYSNPIDYNTLTTIVLKNKTAQDVIINQSMIEEALKILAQEYIICFQPKVELLIWTIIRLIVCWYADPKLFNYVYKIKILINLFRARGDREFNKDQGIYPEIIIMPSYGKKYAIKVLSHLSYFFFPYKKLGSDNSVPTWFDKLDNLMYYTNGSLELKKYVKWLVSSGQELNPNPLTPSMNKINSTGLDNYIEYSI